MFGRRMFREKIEDLNLTKNQGSPPSTEESLSPPNSSQLQFRTKEKSELCRKFMEFGYCSYQRNCKFAHGSHELKRNNGLNSKYKTKMCGAFMNQGHCHFGNRCNFIHNAHAQEDVPDWTATLSEYREIFYSIGSSSKISKLFS
jgi:hypothetical protein